jgi:hypothetical protein
MLLGRARLFRLSTADRETSRSDEEPGKHPSLAWIYGRGGTHLPDESRPLMAVEYYRDKKAFAQCGSCDRIWMRAEFSISRGEEADSLS